MLVKNNKACFSLSLVCPKVSLQTEGVQQLVRVLTVNSTTSTTLKCNILLIRSNDCTFERADNVQSPFVSVPQLVR